METYETSLIVTVFQQFLEQGQVDRGRKLRKTASSNEAITLPFQMQEAQQTLNMNPESPH